jgi:hypothetical protein
MVMLRSLRLLALFTILVGCGSYQSLSPTPSDPETPAPPIASRVPAHTFAFWYESWDPKTTPTDLAPADVSIGVIEPEIPLAHAAGKLVLQYQTYYQAIPDSLLLNSMDDLANVGFQINRNFVMTIFGFPTNSYVLCPSSKLVHERVQKYVQLAFAAGYDGLFIDNTFFDPPAHAICDSLHEHVGPAMEGGRAYLQLLSEVRQTVKAHSPDAILMTNPGDPNWADRIASGKPTLWDLSDYVLWESYGYTSFRTAGHDVWNTDIPKSHRFASAFPEKATKVVALSYVLNVHEARYAFAVARFFGFNWTANIGRNQQQTDVSDGHFGAFLVSIPFQLGQPLGALPPLAKVLHRAFEHGEVFINIDTVAHTITASSGTIYLAGTTIQAATPTSLDLQPRDAAVLISQ